MRFEIQGKTFHQRKDASLDDDVPAALVRLHGPGTGVGFCQLPRLCLAVSSFSGLLVRRVTLADFERGSPFIPGTDRPGHGVLCPF